LNQILAKLELSRNVERILVVLLLAIFFTEGIVALRHMSATSDETHYLAIGRYLIKHQKWDLVDTLLHPPLSYYLHSLPLLSMPIDESLFKIPDINERGRAIMASYQDDRVLQRARVPMLILATALGLIIFCWAKEAYGGAGGLLALLLYVFNPIILANAVQITPDLCLAAFTVLTMYFFWRWRNSPTQIQAILVGVALGLSLLSKYSAVLVVLALAMLVVMRVIFPRAVTEEPGRSWRLSHMAVIVVAALFIVNAGYLFHESFKPLKSGTWESTFFRKLSNTEYVNRLPVPLPRAYMRGMDLQHTVVEKGFLAYLLGKKADIGWYHFYLVAFFLKTPAAFLVLLGLAAFKGRNRLSWIIWVPVLVFPLYFSGCRLSRGVRYILPVYPLLCVWLGPLALWAKDRAGRIMQAGFLAMLVWYVADTVRIAPHYMAYFNEFGGGPDNGVNLLFESDFDWGQEMKGLSDWLRERHIERIKLGYFSTTEPAHYGIKYDLLPCSTPPKHETGLIAVSATALQIYGCYDWIRNYKPIDKVGYTIFIYDIPSSQK
jgi:4-amino-4-deoxy-L-arabinose transferase-like glycosyltransferase